ncbi:MAG: glycine/sarcosine/betaine reductase component B subunit [Clostridiaceae bacterium]|nr:glycine/sarcosine/betaine reductase component B subunit [Clostridiaceae bacterium]
MNLELEWINIRDVHFGLEDSIEDGILTINKEALLEAVKNPIFSSIDVEIAKPGESVRIITVKDVIEPRIKVETKSCFPGIIDGYEMCGEGTTRVLKGCCVTTTGRIIGFQEGIIDMSGPGAEYCPYSNLINIVLVAEPADSELSPILHERAIRILGVKAATHIGRIGLKSSAVDAKKEYKMTKLVDHTSLPKVAYLQLYMAQGLLHDDYVYGMDAKTLPSMMMHPNELLDSAIVSGNCVTSSDKTTTYDFQNHPVIEQLYERHGKDLEFAGMAISPISTVLAEKERGAMVSINLISQLNPDVVIISQEGGGNPEADLMLCCERAEKRGIKTVLLMHDNPGADGTSEPLANTSAMADAIITTGNDNVYLDLPKMQKNIGHIDALRLLSGSPDDCEEKDESIRTGILVIMGAANELGAGKLCSIEY